MYIENLDSIMICGKKVTIERIDNYRSVHGLYGTFHLSELSIKVDAELKGKMLFETLAHEMIHATLAISGVGFLLTNDIEEAIVRALEHSLFEPLLQLASLETLENKKKKKKKTI